MTDIIKLPTMGSSESIKTQKQGRVSNLSGYRTEAVDYSRGKPRRLRRDGVKVYLNNAKRIIHFKNSTTKQKEVAIAALKQLENGETRSIQIINAITRTLSKMYRDF